MFWDKKKNSSTLPDLPPAGTQNKISLNEFQRRSPEIQDNLDEGVHELPSFPDSPMQKGFSQAAIKDAVSNEEISESEQPHMPQIRTTELPEPHNSGQQYSVVEMDDWSPTKALPPQRPMPDRMRMQESNKPVFVRLDKFQVARNSLSGVQQKLSEAEDLLKKIRDVKLREDQELMLWEKEMETIKSRIKTVMSDIFDRTEQY